MRFCGRRGGAAVLAALACVLFSSAAPGGGSPPKLLKGPYLTDLRPTGVDVRLELDPPSAVVVEVTRDGADAGRPRAYEDRAAVAFHLLHAVGLETGTRYAYVVRAGGHAVGGGHFTTSPAADSGAPVRFFVYGDDRSDLTAHAAVARALASTPSDFLVNTGDLVEDGGRAADWQSFFDVEASLLRDRPLFVAIGNHELFDDRAGANFARYFGFSAPDGTPQPYGTVRVSNVRLFFLNTMHDWTETTDRQWLEAQLALSDQEPGLVWKIAVMHQGPWSSGPHGGSRALAGEHVPQLLVAHHVDLILAGHDHLYERGESGGLKYLVSGGGGAPLYRVAQANGAARKDESTYHFVEVSSTDRAIAIAARRVDGSLIERCGFGPGQGWDCDPPAPAAPPSTPSGFAATGSSPSAARANPAEACGCAEVGARDHASAGWLWPCLAASLAAIARGRRRSRGGRG